MKMINQQLVVFYLIIFFQLYQPWKISFKKYLISFIQVSCVYVPFDVSHVKALDFPVNQWKNQPISSTAPQQPNLIINSALDSFRKAGALSIGFDIQSPSIVVSDNTIQKLRDTNILTSSLLEKYRKIDQVEEDDTLLYGNNRALYLIPIIKMNNELTDILKNLQSLQLPLKENTMASFNEILETLNKNQYETKIFKKTFNRYSDNIYYADPNRANAYLGGGATPNSKQTEQYLLRNEILTRINDLKDDIRFAIEDISKNGRDTVDASLINDPIDDCQRALHSLKVYLQLCPSADIDLANDAINIK